MHISVFGTGYVGLVAGACLADVGHQVTCMDVNAERIDQLNGGEVPIFEPGLSTIVAHNVAAGRLRFTTDAAQAVADGELLFIAVGTPPDEDGSADLRYVLEVARTIGQHMDSYKLVIDKSTVPVGTAEKVHAVISDVLEQRGASLEFDVCSNPEFMKEGAAIDDFTRGARIIVGTESERVKAHMQECYAPYNRNHEKLMFMSVRAAELTKYAANAMLATKISFMNEIANLAERLEVDVEDVRRGIGSDPRIGYHFIYPGCGYGGSCFPKDVQALERTARQLGYTPELLSAVESVNLRQKQTLFTKLQDSLGNLSGKTIAVWGLAFKPNTDDMREAPSRTLMEALWQAGAKVQAFDPEAIAECRRIYGERDDLMLAGDRIQAVKGADALVICTEWKEFRSVDFDWLADQLAEKVVIDGRNLYAPSAVKEAGLRYIGVGRKNS
ncbi:MULTISPECIES: UDP-glucose dehydrogenase family protein [Halomonadaceae]|uniref:UDP-glucose dehydrogenase family protein n=1 Tax=Halomonadaceae TaxID=28256 RepID=UPI0012EF613E|nr:MULTISPECIES: UDP-glucose/GDP-mannose dehydrogenase family protein [Halomonas]CAD5257162.1 UDP-glucose 6-dehydrogenase [Halomonas sp. 59]CAD5257395.1 UDP-glucose 6-dehydrogenase [Halomonas sp. 113]CAD5271243.1 UDP-glucose 6-dehydrogenase [Halomonas sp. I3]CAD5291465.1 UDP-glucose 6-dehydrogenase [Halomonas sp. 156]VXB23832.1 UDP-glucose 6-dehydrogenase [Halomonas titanicae]